MEKGAMPDIQSLINQLSLEEKAALCTGASSWTTTHVDRLGIPAMFVADGPHGVRRVPEVDSVSKKSIPATCFPTASCLASTWDRDLINEMGKALGEECISLKVDVLLGPGANMKRSPLGGRNFEYYSEDPYLAGELAISLINGIQSQGVGTSLKHFAVNNQEFQRFSISAEVDERTLREIYFPAFEMAVKKAKPWTIMCAYNKLNGVYCSENHELLLDILKDEWGFEGLVVSDWGAVHDRVASLKAGLDWEMPGPQDRRVKAVVNAVRSAELDESILNESVRRILNVVFKAQKTTKGAQFDLDAHHKKAQKIASEGMVLLKNNGILPLNGQKQIAVIGRSAESPHFQGGGSSYINPTRTSVPLAELKSSLVASDLSYTEGYPKDNTFRQDMIDQAVGLAAKADVALLFIALPSFKESEGYDRPDLDLTAQQVALIQAVTSVQPQTVVILNNGSAVAMSAWIDGAAAVLESWMMGQAGGAAIAEILTGKVNPSGKLSETFPLKSSDIPAHINWPGGNRKVSYGEGIFIGYRYYDSKQMNVLFPFGYGLSYTTFAYSEPKVSTSSFNDVDGLTVSVNVTNTGKVPGKEIVQVYLHDHKSSLVRPQKELKGFEKVDLLPGETKTVSVSLDFRSFAFFHPGYHQWITENGEFDILLGASSSDIRCSQTVTLKSTLELPCVIDKESTVREWMADPRGKRALEPFYSQMEIEARRIFGGGGRYGDSIGMDVMDMVADMPLVSVLLIQQKSLPGPAEDMVEELIRQVHKKV